MNTEPMAQLPDGDNDDEENDEGDDNLASKPLDDEDNENGTETGDDDADPLEDAAKLPAIHEAKAIKGPDAKAELFREAFARAFLSNGFNAKRAYMQLRPKLNEGTAEQCASRMIRDVKTQNKIREIAFSDDADARIITSAYKAQRPKIITWDSLARFMELSMRSKGRLKDGKGNSTNVAIILADKRSG